MERTSTWLSQHEYVVYDALMIIMQCHQVIHNSD